MLTFEIGTEEMPAFDLHGVVEKLDSITSNALESLRIAYDEISIYSTPRRLIVCVDGIPSATEEVIEEFRGPALKVALDAEGNYSKAALGFAKSKGVEIDQLERREIKGVEYLFATHHIPSREIIEVLPSLLERIVKGISWPKSQRWGSLDDYFCRPVRWLLALFGTDVVPFSFAGLESDRYTYGHRFLSKGALEVASAADLIDVLHSAYVLTSETEREESIRAQVTKIEEKFGYVADLPAKTMSEVVNLCEYPTVLVGEFDELFLSVPKEITVDAMLMHQRYFPLFSKDGSLLNKFLITSNGDPAFNDNIIDGNQRVVAARLYDAKFFYDEDLKHPLVDYVEKLSQVVFQESLGTMLDKTKRIESLVDFYASEHNIDETVATQAKRAALLCKADLVSNAVVEFTNTQGIMGSYYALASNEGEEVACAIEEHYRPRFAGDATPSTLQGTLVAFADKLDSICGLFAIDQLPTGSSDPFALRRSAIGILAMIEQGLAVNLSDCISYSLHLFKEAGIKFDEAKVKEKVIEFFIGRAKAILKGKDIPITTIEAVLACGIIEPSILYARAQELEYARSHNVDLFEDLATAYARANNLKDASLGINVDTSLFDKHEELLFEAIQGANSAIKEALAQDDYKSALEKLAELRRPIDSFFEQVMIMDKDETLRANRLKLLNSFIDVFTHIADFSKMSK